MEQGAAARAERQARRLARLQQEQQQQAQALASHDWAQWRSTSRCRSCWAARRRGAQVGMCAGSHTKLRDACSAASGLGHRLFLADFGSAGDASGILAACFGCGAWSVSGRSAKMGEPCKLPTVAGMSALRRMRHGSFPIGDARYHGVRLSALMPLDPAAME